MLALANPGYLTLDSDLTSQPVSDTSETYPDAAYGHMDNNQLGLGYQVAKVGLRSRTYGRLMLSSALHPGDVVSCTQVKALIRAAEERMGFRPRRRTDLLSQRLENQVKDREERDHRYEESLQALEKARAKIPETWQQIQDCQTQLETAEQEYQEQGRKKRPFSKPGKLRSQFEMLQRRKARLEEKIPKLEEQLAFRKKHWMASLEAERELRQRLEQYDQENVTNPFPIRVVFRIDAGFGTSENVAWLIEMGYDVYSRPSGDWLKPRLKHMAEDLTWSRVGNNAEMIYGKG
jgi:hypothetical protein